MAITFSLERRMNHTSSNVLSLYMLSLYLLLSLWMYFFFDFFFIILYSNRCKYSFFYCIVLDANYNLVLTPIIHPNKLGSLTAAKPHNQFCSPKLGSTMSG